MVPQSGEASVYYILGVLVLLEFEVLALGGKRSKALSTEVLIFMAREKVFLGVIKIILRFSFFC